MTASQTDDPLVPRGPDRLGSPTVVLEPGLDEITSANIMRPSDVCPDTRRH
jgi:hypothetical protein